MKNIITSLGLLLLLLSATGCRKYLDIQPKGKMIPETLADFQLLLDNADIMNRTPGLAVISADEFSIPDNYLNFLSYRKNCYIWDKVLFSPLDQVPDWNLPYKQIFTANTILEGLAGKVLSPEESKVKGAALFFRGHAYANLVKQFARLYDPSTAATDPGVPLRLRSDISTTEQRASVKEVYDQVLSDLESAMELLPAASKFKTLPGKLAATGLLARVHLMMGNYTSAIEYADNYLDASGELLDFSTLSDRRPPYEEDPEIAYFGFLNSLPFGISADPDLYGSYDDDDLRKVVFYRPPNPPATLAVPRLINSIGGITVGYFAGISTSEIYLIRAESQAWLDNIPGAMNDLNTLLRTRYADGTYTDKTAVTKMDALEIIFTERRKELPYTNSRWFDLQRKNKVPQLAETLRRTALGAEYVLPPNDPRYVFPIPQTEISISGIAQNER